jgi:hypothetical protein
MALAGHVSRKMMERYSHIRNAAKREAVENLSGADFDAGWAQNRAPFFVSENSKEAKSLKRFGEPGRTRTSNPLIKSNFRFSGINSFALATSEANNGDRGFFGVASAFIDLHGDNAKCLRTPHKSPRTKNLAMGRRRTNDLNPERSAISPLSLTESPPNSQRFALPLPQFPSRRDAFQFCPELPPGDVCSNERTARSCSTLHGPSTSSGS